MQSARVLAGLDWAGTGAPAGWVGGLLAVEQKQRAADGLTGCCDWRSDGGPEHGACMTGADSLLSLALLLCGPVPAPGGGMESLIDSGLDLTQ